MNANDGDFMENLFALEALDSLGGDSDGGVSSGSE
jgi:hypothetical protein